MIIASWIRDQLLEDFWYRFKLQTYPYCQDIYWYNILTVCEEIIDLVGEVNVL